MDSDSQLQLRSLCVPDAPKGQKMAAKKEFNESLEDGDMKLEAAINDIIQLIEDGDDAAVSEIIGDCSEWTFKHVLSKLSQGHQVAVTQIKGAE